MDLVGDLTLVLLSALAGGFLAQRARRPLLVVTAPEFEAGIEMTRQALMRLDVPPHEISRVSSAIRRERYGPRGRDDSTTVDA